MKIRISTKLSICFSIIVLMMLALSYYSVNTTQKHLLSYIGDRTTMLSKEIMQRIDRRIIYLLDDLRLQVKNHSIIQEILEGYNNKFEKIPKVDAYMNAIDNQWILAKGELLPFVQEVTDGALSDRIRDDFMRYDEERFGYSEFREVFLTNRFGAVVALTGMTTDYRQDDEEWWQEAKAKGYYLSNYEFDESSETYGISMAIRLTDDKGAFIGILKAVVSMQGIMKNVEVTTERYTKSRMYLITHDGKLIYGNTPSVMTEDVSGKKYFSMITRDNGYFIADVDDSVSLVSYARSGGSGEFNAFNWTFIIIQDMYDVLGPTLILKNRIYTAAFIIILTTFFIAFLTLRNIKGSIAKLTQGTKAVGSGDLNYLITIENNDEMGELAAAFNQMTNNLKEVTASRDELNMEIAQRMQIEDKLRRHQEKLIEMVAERTINLQNLNEELEKEIADRTSAENEARLMALFAELNPSPVFRFDIDGIITVANRAASEILNSGSLIGKPLTGVLPETAGIDLAGCIRSGSVFSHVVQKGDRFYYFMIKGIKEMNFGQAYGSDITDRKLAEAEAMRSAQLASLGELAAGIAHEINNPINGIINFAQIMLNKPSLDMQINDLAGRIIREGDRIADIIRSLLSFARSGDRGKRPAAVPEIINDTLVLTARLLKKDGIFLDLIIPARLPMILANPQQIEQVLLNLASNARYALNQKYPVTHPDKKLKIICEIISDKGSDFVRITFHDNGTGIPNSIIDKIMNPFFSTKPSNQGTGLGLSISHGIITDHGGRIRFESEEGVFTKAIIELRAVIPSGED